MGKHFNPNLVKIHRNYDVGEVANLLGVHQNTVREWIKNGLATNDNKRPVLILGSILKGFLQAKRKKNKQKCQPFEIYCVRCRLPQLPAGNMVDYEALNSCSGRLMGICPACDGIINKYINFAKLTEIQDKLDITKTKVLEHINEST
tara:strand:- start:601 stop:1041 length:441 start_codon:yes stop_codon:yes gene_type:complete